jgi:hypothetical protein
VLSQFDGRNWQADPVLDAMAMPQLRVSGEPIRYQMLIEPSKRRWLTCWMPPRPNRRFRRAPR